jgi:uncharacterized protein (TIGR03437 family)
VRGSSPRPRSANDPFGAQIAGTSVSSFNGIAAPMMIYTRAPQVAVVVPFGITGATAQVIEVSTSDVK